MLVIPAIDLLNGNVVRLRQGEENSAVVYSESPLETARCFEKAGARWIHVVNLDGAFDRPEMNQEMIRTLCDNISAPIELGGGIRTMEQIGFWLNRGVGRVIVGSAAVHDPDMVQKAVKRYGNEAIVAGIDLRDGCVAVHGWTEKTGMTAVDMAARMCNLGISRIIVTDIATDGMLTGPALDIMLEIADKTGLIVIASGGVGSMDDIAGISRFSSHGIEGVIVGRAIYENRLDIGNAIQKFQGE